MTWLDALTLETVVVHMRDMPSMKGLKQAVYEDCLVLRDALVMDDGTPYTLAGEVVIPREQVTLIQLVKAD
jgi:hypothetical protein